MLFTIYLFLFPILPTDLLDACERVLRACSGGVNGGDDIDINSCAGACCLANNWVFVVIDDNISLLNDDDWFGEEKSDSTPSSIDDEFEIKFLCSLLYCVLIVFNKSLRLIKFKFKTSFDSILLPFCFISLFKTVSLTLSASFFSSRKLYMAVSLFNRFKFND